MSPQVLRNGKFSVGQIVRHRLYSFRGVIFDVDPVFNNTEEWYNSIPAERLAVEGSALLSSAGAECPGRALRGLFVGTEPVA